MRQRIKNNKNNFNLKLPKVFSGGNVCHPGKVLPEGAGRTVQFLNESRNKLWEEIADKDFRYNIVELPPETVTIIFSPIFQ